MSVGISVLAPLRIGSEEYDPPLFLAPMAGFTDAPMRRMASRYGASLTFTEMANARALSQKCSASWRILETLPDEGRVAAHIYGYEPEFFARAAELICAEGRFAAIDINCGCPVPKIAKGGAGAALMRDPRLMGEIIAATVRGSTLPVTVKTRVGWRRGEPLAEELVRIAADNGAAAMALHGRFADQHHSGEVHYDLMARAVALDRLPIIGNGGITGPGQAREMIEKTGVAGIMPGWAAVGDPWLFADLRGFLRGGGEGPREEASVAEVRSVLLEHLSTLREHRFSTHERWPLGRASRNPEEVAVLDFRGQLFRYLKGMRNVTRLRGSLSRLLTMDDIYAAVEEIFEAEMEFRARVGRR